MLTSPDLKNLLNILEKHKVRYLVVGDYAVMKYTEPRFTKDLDLWISTDEENAKAVFSALKKFGAPLKGLTPHDFTERGYFYQMGNPPFRLDIMMSIPGVEFETAWEHREEVLLEGGRVHRAVYIEGGLNKGEGRRRKSTGSARCRKPAKGRTRA